MPPSAISRAQCLIAEKILASAAEQDAAGNPESAVRLCRQALAMVPGHIEATLLLALCLARSGDAAQGIGILEQAIAQHPDNPELFTVLGRTSLVAGRRDEAIRALEQAIALRPDHARAWYTLGLAQTTDTTLDRFLDVGDDDASGFGALPPALQAPAASFQRAIDLDPSMTEAHVALASLCVNHDNARAFAVSNAGLKQDPRQPTLFLVAAHVLVGNGQTADCNVLLDDAIHHNPESVDLLVFYGWFQASRGLFEDAVPLLERALAVDGGSNDACRELAVALRGAGRSPEALAALDRVPPRPGDMEWLYQRAQCLQDVGRLDEALAELSRITPNRRVTMARLSRARADCHARQGRRLRTLWWRARWAVLETVRELRQGIRHLRTAPARDLPAAVRTAALSLALILTRLIRPMVLVRFCPVFVPRIGHMIDIEFYLSQRDLGMHPRRTLDIFYYAEPVSNRCLLRKYQEHVRLVPWGETVVNVDKHIPGWEAHHFAGNLFTRDPECVLSRTRNHVTFSEREDREAWAALRDMGVNRGDRIVCFHARDSAYLRTAESGIKANDWWWHDYRDSDIENYMPAIEEMTHRGYKMLRMGAVVEKPIKTDNPNIIDYATVGRSEFLDIWLCANCAFFIGNTSGICIVPMMFRKPILFVDFAPLEFLHSWHPDYLNLPKKLWLRRENRFMTFREVIESGAGRFQRSDQYVKADIDIRPCSPEEITAAVLELHDRVTGVWQTTEEDEDLQRRFRALFKPSSLQQRVLARVSADFLRRNRDLLD
ncbi:MAG: tetratricopeptide repeat protein [Alphaproteobacteria bacterium]